MRGCSTFVFSNHLLAIFRPQQAGNVPYVTEGGFGSFSKDPRKIADTVSRWLRDDDLLAKMSNKAKEASRPKVGVLFLFFYFFFIYFFNIVFMYVELFFFFLFF